MEGSLVLFPAEHSMAAWAFTCAHNLVCLHGYILLFPALCFYSG